MDNTSQSHTVLVLGAGASVSEAIHFRRTRINQHPPLDANFFRRAKKNAEAGLVTPVARQADQVGQSNLFRDDPPVSLEEHLGRIYFAMRNEATPATRRAYLTWFACTRVSC